MQPPRQGCFVSVTPRRRRPRARAPTQALAREIRPIVIPSRRHLRSPWPPQLLRCVCRPSAFTVGCDFAPALALASTACPGAEGLVPGSMAGQKANTHVLGIGLSVGKTDSTGARTHLRPVGPRAQIARRRSHGGPRDGRLPGGPRHPLAPRGRRRRAHSAPRAPRLAATTPARKRRDAAGRGARGPPAARMDAATGKVAPALLRMAWVARQRPADRQECGSCGSRRGFEVCYR